MVKTTLLATDLTIGSLVLEYLDRSKLGIRVAAWVYLEDYEEWRFALASPRLDVAGGAKAYGMVREALEAAELSYAKTPTFVIFGMKERFIKDLRAQFPKIENSEGVHFGTQRIGDRYVEDAILYRVR